MRPLRFMMTLGIKLVQGQQMKAGYGKVRWARTVIRRMPCLAHQAMRISEWLLIIGAGASVPGTLVIHNRCKPRIQEFICIQIVPFIVLDKPSISAAWHDRHSMVAMTCLPSIKFRLSCEI